jgi:hypothetical protein
VRLYILYIETKHVPGNKMNTFPKALLSIDTNAKTVKGQEYGFMTGILYMAPSDVSGFNTCAMAEVAQCKTACLYTAGRGGMSNVQKARINKTVLFFTQREEFMQRIVADIAKLIVKASKKGLTPLVRLNGTSDIKWENVPVTIGNVTYQNVMAVFPAVQFYDYTKIANRRNLPANYDLTYSYSGVSGYRKYVELAKAAGMRIAVVFRSVADIPELFEGMECIGGDDSDIRHMEPQGVVVALYAKGQAKRDTTGFVVDTVRHTYPVFPINLAA